jgi:hypothetical protein
LLLHRELIVAAATASLTIEVKEAHSYGRWITLRGVLQHRELTLAGVATVTASPTIGVKVAHSYGRWITLRVVTASRANCCCGDGITDYRSERGSLLWTVDNIKRGVTTS